MATPVVANIYTEHGFVSVAEWWCGVNRQGFGGDGLPGMVVCTLAVVLRCTGP